ncbi:LacI family DNA-binding transcriptional regulator [Methylovirgula sp. 4M-Z18]|uniref:LacI family DNA-binding transcriptional regulator n=1 Tax=Methylovirgula sp. 4M-Z18 TaxID=2293567 RepID=UPI000E2F3514|nr:LacI family DNA-binding transcriptional regulator [Methylovirgula sp. 4M-Z18]RFB79075.1 LacI family DNA-binding transcriptional regulator [Methylovirgula sp. 4M-Z18]
MTDVAEAAGVSQTTVSLVLNGAGSARLAGETRERVLKAAQALDYRLIKRGLLPKTPGGGAAIGFVANEMSTDPWTAIALDGAREKAWEHGLTILSAVTGGDAEREQAILAHMASQPLLGLIYGTMYTRRIERPQIRNVPTVLLNCYLADGSLPSIVPGEIAGGHTATRRLLRAGHRRIGHIMGEARMDASHDRLKGYRNALANADLPFDPDLVRPGNWEPSSGYEQTQVLMRLAEPPTAIFCANDLMAIGCMDALKEMGKRIPDDVAVIGYDNRDLAPFTRPALTTVLLPHYEMGEQAVDYLVHYARRPPLRAPQLKVECPLIERRSVGPAASVPC